jgi:uncharacterized protein (TIGR00369 family)
MKEQAGFHGEDAGFTSRVRESFERQGLMKHLGAELVELTAGHAAIRVPFRAELTQQHNYFHAGISGAIADSAWRVCGVYANAGGQLRADGGIQIEFAGARGWGGIDGAGARGAVWKNVEDLRGGRSRQEEWEGSILRDDAGDDYVPAGEVG